MAASSSLAAAPSESYHPAIPVPGGPIHTGQGEYIAFSGSGKEVSRETFDKVYQVFDAYNPATVVSQHPESAAAICAKRYEQVQNGIKLIDDDLEIAFVPRTLYELIFIRECIQEDVNAKSICKFWHPLNHREIDLIDKMKRKCWHLCCFQRGDGDATDAGVREVAYRLNQVIVEKLSPKAEGFTFEQISQHTEREIAFFQEYRRDYRIKQKKEEEGEDVDFIHYELKPRNLTVAFGAYGLKYATLRMSMRDEQAKLIRDAVAIECSTIAQTAFIFFQAYHKRNPLYTYCGKGKGYHCSIAYLYTSLFSTVVYSGRETGYTDIRESPDALALPVPFEEANKSPVPFAASNTVVDLFRCDPAPINLKHPVDQKNEYLRSYEISHLTKKDFLAQVEEYYGRAILLKGELPTLVEKKSDEKRKGIISLIFGS